MIMTVSETVLICNVTLVCNNRFATTHAYVLHICFALFRM